MILIPAPELSSIDAKAVRRWMSTFKRYESVSDPGRPNDLFDLMSPRRCLLCGVEDLVPGGCGPGTCNEHTLMHAASIGHDSVYSPDPYNPRGLP